jgi:hypothetical protein
MNTFENPPWWNSDHDFTWDHAKLAMERGLNTMEVRGWNSFLPWGQPSFKEFKSAYRFGYGARLQYWTEHDQWSDDLERVLHKDWRAMYPKREAKWEDDRNAIRYSWSFAAEKSDDSLQIAA